MIAERNLLERAYKFISSARALDFGEDRVCMWAAHLSADIAAYLASGIEAASAAKTAQTGLAEGESAGPKGDAQP